MFIMQIQLSNQIKDRHDERPVRSIHHSLVTTCRRDKTAIRREVVSTATNFLAARMDAEQEERISLMKSKLLATSCQQMICAGDCLVRQLFPGELCGFGNSVCKAWYAIRSALLLPVPTDQGCISISSRL